MKTRSPTSNRGRSLQSDDVETVELAFRRDNHCDEIQRFHFSRPIVPHAIEDELGGRGPKVGVTTSTPISSDHSFGWGKPL